MTRRTSTTSNDRRPVTPPKAADLVAQLLRTQILDGALPPGTRLPNERDLVALLQVSRPTLREAMHLLAAEELVATRRGAHGGAVVRRPSAAPALRLAAAWWAVNGGEAIPPDVIERASADPAILKSLDRLGRQLAAGKFRSVA